MTYLSLSGTGYVDTPDHASLDITGDIDLRVAIALDDWTPGTEATLVNKANAELSYLFDVLTNGKLRFAWSADGSSFNLADSSVAPTVPNGGLLLVRATGEVPTTVKFYTKSSNEDDAPDDLLNNTGWTQLGTTQATTATASIFSSSSSVRIGVNVVGKLYAALILDGVNGTTIADPDFTEPEPDITSFTDSAGRTWTLHGDAVFVGPVLRTPAFALEAAFPVTADMGYLVLDDPSLGKLDEARLASETVWVDLTQADDGTNRVRMFSTQRGSSRVQGPVVKYEAGTLSADLNNADGDLDPTNLSGPYVRNGVSDVTPFVPVRSRATWAGVTYDLWKGFADDWAASYSKALNYASVTLTATDGFKVLQNNTRPQLTPRGAGEDSGARISRILDSAEWSAEDRVIATGDTTLLATTLEGDALAEIQAVVETEIGEGYINGAGQFVFRNRLANMTETRSHTPQGTFTSDGTGLRYYDISTTNDAEALFNQARVARAGGEDQEANDVESQERLGRAAGVERIILSFERTDLQMETDAVALAYASFVVYQSKDPELRFAELVLKPSRSPDELYPHVLGREIGDRITIQLDAPWGDTISRDCFIRGIKHDVNFAAVDWTTTWALQSATKWSFLVLDHPVLGRLDESALAY